jgi:type IV secretion system protein VirD4
MRIDRKLKKRLILTAPYLMFVYLFGKVSQAIRLAPGTDASQKLLHLGDGFSTAFSSALPSFNPTDLLIGLAGAVIMWIAVYVKGKNAKKFRKNMEYGSARWGTADDITPFMDKNPKNNLILTQTEGLTMNSRPKDPKTARNKNVLVIGGSGSGKTRFFVKPNIMQCCFADPDFPTSIVCTDPKGSLVVECGRLLERAGYKIKILNTINFKKSHHYNPFAYIHSEKDILKLVNTLITNTKGEGKGSDDFWLKAETLLYTALIGYIYYEAPQEEQNFATLVEFVNAMEVREDDETFENNVDIAFRELGERDPNHFAVRQWRKYKLAAGKTAKSINISAGARLAPFDIQELREITMYDELELDTLGGTKKGDTQKTALFLIMSDTDSTFNFLISMVYSQLFNLLCEKADDEFGGRLPIHVRCLIDECANIGQIPNLEKLMATIRSREISACLVLQAQSQLKALYKDSADTIIGNCDASLFLGGKEPTTLKELNQTLGKETIDTFNTGESRGREVSHSLNYQKLGKDLATVDELAVLDGGKCILQLRGVRPFLSDKYDITKHPNYRYLSDADKRNEFDIERFLSRRLKPKPDEVYDSYEIDASVMDADGEEPEAE